VLTQTSLGRGSGFPRLALAGDHLVLIWTEDGQPTRLRARRVPLDELGPTRE
jgi:hypothetical protein